MSTAGRAAFDPERAAFGSHLDEARFRPRKAIEFARPAGLETQLDARRAHDPARDQLLAEIALVERAAERAFVKQLQLREGEPWPKQVPCDGGAFEFRTKPIERGRDDVVVIVGELADLVCIAPLKPG